MRKPRENARLGGRKIYVVIILSSFITCAISGILLNLPDPVS